MVARRTETLPYLIRIAARHGADLAPLALKGDEFLGSLLPLAALLQRLGRLAKFGLELQVVLHVVLNAGIELSLGLEELVARGAETLVDARIVLLGGEAYRTPYLLYLKQTLARLVPLLTRRIWLLDQSFRLLAQVGLQFEVLHLLLLDALEILLMLFVYARRGGLEPLPQRILVFIGHGTRLAPLVMQFLQLVERLHRRRLGYERLGLLAQLELLLVVLLQVQIAQLLVYLDEVVEVLHMQVVGLPQILDILLRHHADLLPTLLQLAELGKGVVQRLVRIDQLLQLIDDGQLGLEVLLLDRVEIGHILVTATAILLEEILQPYLQRIHRGHELLALGRRCLEGLARSLHLGTMELVEGHLYGLHALAQRLHGFGLQHAGKHVDQLLLALAAEIVLRYGTRRLLVSLLRIRFSRFSRFGRFKFGITILLCVGFSHTRRGLFGDGISGCGITRRGRLLRSTRLRRCRRTLFGRRLHRRGCCRRHILLDFCLLRADLFGCSVPRLFSLAERFHANLTVGIFNSHRFSI